MTGMRYASRTGCSWISLTWLLLLSACSHTTPTSHQPPLVEVRLDDAEAPLLQPPAAHPVEAINAALKYSRRIQACLLDARRAAARAGRAGELRSPEIRIGADWGGADGSGNSRQTGIRQGGSLETGSRSSRDVYPTYETPRSTRQDSTFTSSERTTSGNRYSWEDVDTHEWGIGLRLFPPNPWLYAAEVSEAEAEWHYAEARLRAEQLELSRDVAVESLNLGVRMKQLALYRQLDGICSRQLARGGKMPLDTQTDLLRRSLGIQAEMARTERRLFQALNDLERLTGIPVDVEAFLADWSWLPGESLEDKSALQGLLDQAATARPDVALAYWRACAYQAEYDAMRADGIPWIKQIELSYSQSRREETSGYQGDSTATEFSRQSGSSQTDYTSGRRRVDAESSFEKSWSSESESGSSDSNRDGDEWRIEAAIEIPVFEWFLKSNRETRDLATLAWQDVGLASEAAKEDLRATIRALQKSENDLRRFKTRVRPQVDDLKSRTAKLLANRNLKPDDELQLSAQIVEMAVELLAYEQAWIEARIRFWIACGAPLSE